MKKRSGSRTGNLVETDGRIARYDLMFRFSIRDVLWMTILVAVGHMMLALLGAYVAF